MTEWSDEAKEARRAYRRKWVKRNYVNTGLRYSISEVKEFMRHGIGITENNGQHLLKWDGDTLKYQESLYNTGNHINQIEGGKN